MLYPGFFMSKLRIACAALVLAQGCTSTPTESNALADAHRGSLLYDTACGACHTTQPHWRETRIVTSWDELLRQVTGWQSVAGQNWNAEDVRDVAAYLNRTFYRLPCPVAGCSAAPG